MTQIDEPNLDEQLDDLLERFTHQFTNNKPLDRGETITSIKALIANQVREARVDELEKILGWHESTNFLPRRIRKRLKTLKL